MSSPDMVDWDLAVATGVRLARPGPDVSRAQARRAVTDLRAAAHAAERHVRDFTGLDARGGESPVAVVDRPAWIRANAASFRVVLDPLVEKLRDRRESSLVADASSAVGSRVTGMQVGSLLAYLSGKVLGQYELFSAADGTALVPQTGNGSGPTTDERHGEPNSERPRRAGRLLLVAPNVVAAEQEMGVDPRDFRLWVCVHEETHRVQFTAVPWLREHLQGEIRDFLVATDVDPSAVARRLRDALGGVLEAVRGSDGAALIDAVQTPEQRVILDRLTAVMSLLEGHASYVMDGVGPSVIPTVREISERFQRRRRDATRLELVMRRLLGIDAKLKQYRDGERFVRGVVDRVGMAGFNRVWDSPETLPTSDEVLDPQAWVTRVHGRPAVGSGPG